MAPDEELVQRVGAMLASVGFWGMAQLQFVGAGADAALIDFNPRFYGSLPLALAAGANLPARWHSVALSEPAGSPTEWLHLPIGQTSTPHMLTLTTPPLADTTVGGGRKVEWWGAPAAPGSIWSNFGT